MTWFFFPNFVEKYTVIFLLSLSFARVTTSKRVISRDARSRPYLALLRGEIFLPFNSIEDRARDLFVNVSR